MLSLKICYIYHIYLKKTLFTFVYEVTKQIYTLETSDLPFV